MICYVDDLLTVGFKTKEDMDVLNLIYNLKEVFGPPDQYLGANVEKVHLKGGKVVWSTKCVDYLKGAIEHVDNSLGLDKTELNNYVDGHRPYSSRLWTELNVTEELGEELINRYQQLIGVLRWSIELGSIDILMDLSFLYQHLCYPREGHLDAVYRIFRYLQKNLGKNPGRMAFDPIYEPTDDNLFEVFGRDLDDWKYLYPDSHEIMARHMPEVLGKYVMIKSHVDANHAGNMANSRSHSGIIIYVNNAPIILYSKRQNKFDT